VDAAPVALADMHADAGERSGALAHRFEVAAGGERLAGAGQNDTAQLTIGVDLRRRIGEQLAIALLAQGIAGVGPIDRKGCDRTVFLEQQRRHEGLRIPDSAQV